MKAVCKKLVSLMLVAVLLISAIPFAASADAVEVKVIFKSSALGVKIKEVDTVMGVSIKDNVPSDMEARKACAGDETYGSLDKDMVVTGWSYVKEDGSKGDFVPGTTILTAEMQYSEGKIILVPSFGYSAKQITLDANGGQISGASSVKHKVKVGGTYGEFAVLPEATRQHHTFNGWYIKDADGKEIMLTNDMQVNSYTNAYAKWTVKNYNVKAYKFDLDSGTWAEDSVASVEVQAGKTVASAEAGFKARAEGAAALDNGFTIVGWERVYNDGTGKTETFSFSDTKVYADTNSGDVYIRPIYQGKINLDMTDATNLVDQKHTVQIGKPINLKGNLYVPDHTNSGLVFMGWQANSDPENRWDVDQTKNYNPKTHGYTFFAEWGTPATIKLHLADEDYKILGVTKTYQIPTDKEFVLKNVNLSDKVSGYDKNKMTFYDDVNWDKLTNGNGPVAKVEKINAYTLEPGKLYHYYVVLVEAENSGSNSGSTGTTGSTNGTQATTPTKTPSDPTNAQTGDSSMIYVSMGTMIAAAAVLMVVMQLRKRKMI